MTLRLDASAPDFEQRFIDLLGMKRESSNDVDTTVRDIIADVVARGDAALIDYSKRFDRIDLAAIDADPALAGDQAFTWIGAAAFSGRAGELRVVPGLVQGDLDGDGLADFEIGLEGGVLPGADSFFL